MLKDERGRIADHGLAAGSAGVIDAILVAGGKVSLSVERTADLWGMRSQIVRLLDLYLNSAFSREVLMDRKRCLESTIEAFKKERNSLCIHLEA